MNIVICGAGSVGRAIAEYLGEEYTITVIDSNPQRLSHIEDQLDVRTVLGDASNPEILKKAGTKKAGIFIAVTTSDEVNIIAVQMAHALFDVPLKIIRLRACHMHNTPWTQEYANKYLPVDVIVTPEKEAAEEILRHLLLPFALCVLPFFDAQVYVVSILIENVSDLTTTPIKHLEKIFRPIGTTIIKVVRGQVTFVPCEHDLLEIGDKVYFLVPKESLEEFSSNVGHPNASVKRLLILGGGRSGVLLAEAVETTYPHITSILIESKNSKTQQLVSRLNHTIIMQGDGLDPHILEEAGVSMMDSMVAMTDDDNINILGSLLAKSHGAKRTTALIKKQSYLPLVQSLDIDKFINPSLLMISMILKHVRKEYIKSLYKLGDKSLDIFSEIVLLPNTPAIGRTVQSINHQKDLWIIGIMRNKEVFDFSANTILQEGDILLLMCSHYYTQRTHSFFDPKHA